MDQTAFWYVIMNRSRHFSGSKTVTHSHFWQFMTIFSENVESLAGVTLKDPERIVLTSNEDGIQEKFAVPESLSLNVAVIPPKQRLVLLVASVLKTNKSLVFVNTMAEVNFLHEVLTHMDLPRKVKRTFFRLHGDMEQAERVENFTQFQKTDKGNKEPDLTLFGKSWKTHRNFFPKIQFFGG